VLCLLYVLCLFFTILEAKHSCRSTCWRGRTSEKVRNFHTNYLFSLEYTKMNA
jgi:hypothetical protein